MVSFTRPEPEPVRIGSSLPTRFKPAAACLLRLEFIEDIPVDAFDCVRDWIRDLRMCETGRFLYRVVDGEIAIENGWMPSRTGLMCMGYPVWGWDGVATPRCQTSLVRLGLTPPMWDDILREPLQWRWINAWGFGCGDDDPRPTPSHVKFWNELFNAQIQALAGSDGVVRATIPQEFYLPQPQVIGQPIPPVPQQPGRLMSHIECDPIS